VFNDMIYQKKIMLNISNIIMWKFLHG